MPSRAPIASSASRRSGDASASSPAAWRGSWKEYTAVFSSATVSASCSVSGRSAGRSGSCTSAISPAAEACSELSIRSRRAATTGAGAEHPATARRAVIRPRSPARIPAASPTRRAVCAVAPPRRTCAATEAGRLGAPRRIWSPSITSSWTTKAVCRISTAAATWIAASCREPPRESWVASRRAGRNLLPPSVASPSAFQSRWWSAEAIAPPSAVPRRRRRLISWSTPGGQGMLMRFPPEDVRAGRPAARAARRPRG